MPGVVVSGTILFYALGLAVLVGTYMMPSNKDKGCVGSAPPPGYPVLAAAGRARRNDVLI